MNQILLYGLFILTVFDTLRQLIYPNDNYKSILYRSYEGIVNCINYKVNLNSIFFIYFFFFILYY
jgi:hypothetical protein